MDRYIRPHLCLLCDVTAPPFKNFYQATAHVRSFHAADLGDCYPEEYVRYVGDPEKDPLDVLDGDDWLVCLHCRRLGRHTIKTTEKDMDAHFKSSHVDSDFARMGLPKPEAQEGEDYCRESVLQRESEEALESMRRQLESLRGVTDFLTDAGIGFFNVPPEESE